MPFPDSVDVLSSPTVFILSGSGETFLLGATLHHISPTPDDQYRALLPTEFHVHKYTACEGKFPKSETETIMAGLC